LSPDGKRIVVERSSAGITQLWLVETDRGVASRFAAGSSSATSPVWSPDSRTIVFTRVGSGSLFRKDVNALEGEELLTRRPGLPIPSDWSSDGRWLLEEEFLPETKFDLWALPMITGGKLDARMPLKPYVDTPFEERFARLSPDRDSRWIAYTSDESGRNEVYVDTFPKPHGKKQISTTGGSFPKWGAGGRDLFYVSPDRKLMVVSLKSIAESLEPSVPRVLFPFPAAAATAFEVADDKQRFLVLAGQEQISQPLTLFVNWPSLLQKASAP
jgi:Tol biopolymer transport system component